MLDPLVLKLVSICFGLLFLLAAVHKLTAFQTFRGTLAAYQLLPTALVAPASIIVPVFEALLGAAWLLHDQFAARPYTHRLWLWHGKFCGQGSATVLGSRCPEFVIDHHCAGGNPARWRSNHWDPRLRNTSRRIIGYRFTLRRGKSAAEQRRCNRYLEKTA
jgi:hypothetical protein